MTLDVTSSPFHQEQLELLNRLLPTLTPDQMVWLTGYLSGVRNASPGSVEAAAALAGATPPPPPAAEPEEITVLFGSQTGNAAQLAEEMSEKLKQRGFRVALSSMRSFQTRNLKKTRTLLVLVSTHGEGDPPDNAIQFHEFLHSKRAPKLDDLRFSVLALGDISYNEFCQTGKEFDARLEALGAERLHPRADCDVDYDEPAAAWMEGVVASLCRVAEAVPVGAAVGSVGALPAAPASLPIMATCRSGATAAATAYSRARPFPAEVLDNVLLNGRGSDKETHHLELSLEGSNLAFEPGDSLGIHPQNCPKLVGQLIEAMRWEAEEPVLVGETQRPLRDVLRNHYEITVLTKPLVQKAVDFSRDGLHELLLPDRVDDLTAYLGSRDLLDLVRDFSLAGTPARDFLEALRKLPPRLYSIASSYQANPDEVHVAVATVRWHAHSRERLGVCSVQCAERVKPGDTMPVYIHKNPNFRLPADPSAPIIMIGPGTGVAPFRAFLEEREVTGATGRSWLFFGDRRFRTDFLYQLDWQRWLADGVLTRMDVAFSRDTDRKVYVQHRMRERSRDFYAWLQEGAYVYICGDEKRMAPDVEAAMVEIVRQEGHRTAEDATAYIDELKQQQRYQRDVY